MAFLRKLFFFLIGVGLGSLMVYFLFGNRDIQCSYFPNDRVLYDLRKKNLVIEEPILQELESLQLDTSDISALLRNGKVDFKQSNTKVDSCKTYWIDYSPPEAKEFSVMLQNCDSTAYLLQVN